MEKNITSQSDAITIWQEALYAAPYSIKALALTPLVVFIPSFYSVDHGLPLALVGVILFLIRIADIVTDPLIGIVSDSATWRLGRRKPIIVCGLPVLVFAAWMVFVPPVDVTPLYAAFWLFAVYLGFTMIDIPYRAWGADLVSSYDGRTRISGWREAATICSGLLAQGVIIVAPLLGLASTADTLRLMASLFIIALPVVLGLSVWKVPEPPEVRFTSRKLSVRESLAPLLVNKPFLWLLGGMAVLMSGAIIGASLHLLVMDNYFGIRHLFPYVLAAENLTSLLAVPFWVWLSRRTGKNVALAIAAFGMGAMSAPIPLLSPDQGLIYAAVIVTRGFMLGALGILIGSMIADVTDVDLKATGRSRSGLFFACTGMVTKLGIALGVLVGLVLPPVFGFDPKSSSNTKVAEDALLMTYAWIPMIIMGGSSYFFWRYPLTRSAYETTQAELKEQLKDLPVSPVKT